MSQPGYPPPDGTGERWSVNMPAVIGVVFVFLVAVIVWVIATGGDSDDAASAETTSAPTAAPAALVTTTLPGATTPPTAPATAPTTAPTSAAPVETTLATTIVSTTPPTSTEPPTTTAPATTAPTTAPATTAPATTAPATTQPDDGEDGDPVSGDLGIAGTPMRKPPCDDTYITIIASAIGDEAGAASIASVLSSFPGSNYLRTDQTCPSLNPSLGGEPIYVIYFGPYDDEDDACDARSRGTSGAYVRVLSTTLGPGHSVTCG